MMSINNPNTINCNTPQPPEYDHVVNFIKYVSWVEAYQYIGRVGVGYHYKIKVDDGNPLDTVFCCANEFWDVVEKISSPDDVMVIVDGKFLDIEIDRFVFTNQKPITPFFLDIKARFHYNQLLLNLLDGVIQNKFDEMCKKD